MLTGKELQILKLLRENSRMTVTELARKVNLPRSTVYEKIKKFKYDGIIKKYSCLINFDQLGLPICAKILFKISGQNKTKFEEELANFKNTNSVVKLGNEFDYLASFMFSSMNDLHEYLDELVAKYPFKDYKILYVTKEMKCEGFLLQN